MVVQGRRLLWQAIIGAGLADITLAWDEAVLGGLLLTPSFQEAMHRPSVTTISMISSAFILGAWLGSSLVIFVFGISLGRRTWLLIGNVVGIIGTLIAVTSFSTGQMIAGRVLLVSVAQNTVYSAINTIKGIGAGFVKTTAAIYVSEMVIETDKRSSAVIYLVGIASLGSASAYWLDFGMVFAHGQVVWRFPVAFLICFALASTALLYPLPDSPRYYYASGRDTEADKVLGRLCVDLSEKQFDRTKSEVLASLELERRNASLSFADLFWDNSSTQAGRRIRIGVIVQSLQYLQGHSFIFYYMGTVFEKYLGLPPLTASGLSGAASTGEAIATWMVLPFVERFGRRTWLISGAILQTLFLAAVTGLAPFSGPRTGAAGAAMIFGYCIALGATWGPIPGLYSAEVMPLRYRQLGYALAASANWACQFVTVFAGPIAYADGGKHGWTTWIWFLVFCAVSVVYAYFFCPETRGLSLEEIDLVFLSKELKETDAARVLVRGADTSSSITEMGEATFTAKHDGV
ncbi:MAG: hypothetical protein ASARMPRED_003285 [Alectoria sarmentosa]|nr:MAG: hypothetical protein ASARMPRED_003285 [Alectoria sarmentosa]